MVISKEAALLKITEIIGSQRFAVVATDSGEHIHTSLVCFTVSKDLNCFFFGTPRNTRKYKFLKKNGKVGFNISDNKNYPEDTHNAYAVTAHGEGSELYDNERQRIADLLMRKYPHLKEFYEDPATALFIIKIKEYSITSNFQQVVTLSMGKEFCV